MRFDRGEGAFRRDSVRSYTRGSVRRVVQRMVWRDRAKAIAWAERRLAERGRLVTGKAEQIHVVAWSTVIRIPTDRGAVYLKATWPPQRHAAALTEALA